MRGYNGWSGPERKRLGDIHSALLRQHPQYRATVCQACGKDSGTVHQHLEDYMDPLQGIIGLCIRCHMAVHERFTYPKMWERYCRAIREGWVFRRAAHWRAALQDMAWTSKAFSVAVVGPDRGPTILDEIGTGKWERIGPGLDDTARKSDDVHENQISMFDEGPS